MSARAEMKPIAEGLTLVEHVVAEIVKRHPDNSPGEWAVIEETLDIVRSLPVEQRMEAMGMRRWDHGMSARAAYINDETDGFDA